MGVLLRRLWLVLRPRIPPGAHANDATSREGTGFGPVPPASVCKKFLGRLDFGASRVRFRSQARELHVVAFRSFGIARQLRGPSGPVHGAEAVGLRPLHGYELLERVLRPAELQQHLCELLARGGERPGRDRVLLRPAFALGRLTDDVDGGFAPAPRKLGLSLRRLPLNVDLLRPVGVLAPERLD